MDLSLYNITLFGVTDDTTERPTIRDLLQHSTDPTVDPIPPEQPDKKQVLWDTGPYPTDSDYK